MKTLILVSMPPEVVAHGRRREEFDLCGAALGLAGALPEAAVEIVSGRPMEILAALERHAPEVVLNACEAPLGRPDLEAHVASLFEWRGVRFTGNRSETLALCRRKDRTKAVLAAAGIAVPRADVFPCIVKPRDEDGSAGVSRESVCADEAALDAAVTALGGNALVEEYLTGREFSVSLWGDERPEHGALAEWRFSGGLGLVTYLVKWVPESLDFAQAQFVYPTESEPCHAAVMAVARATWMAVAAHGYLRVDIRLDAAGCPHVIDVNPNPDLGPPGGMHRAIVAAGWTWERFVRQQLVWA